MNLIRLVYVSSASASFTPAELAELGRRAAARNAAEGINGMLLYHEGCIIQAIEGTEAAIDELMARLECDPRHYGMLVLLREPIEQRDFAGWSMGSIHSAELAGDDRRELAHAIGDAAPVPVSRARLLLESFARNAR
jgi:hypothetical protein